MKKYLTLSLLLIPLVFTYAQYCSDLEYITQGSTWEMGFYDKKGKQNMVSYYEVNSMQNLPDGVKWNFTSTMKDKKDKEMNKLTFDVLCQRGILKFDMVNSLDPNTMQMLENMEIEMTASTLEYPAQLNPGMQLEDGSLNIKGKSGPIGINMTVEVLDRKVESQEEINVSAGSFKAFKISQTTKISSKLFNRSISSIEYFVPGFGVIKSVTLDKKGETSSYSELIAFKN